MQFNNRPYLTQRAVTQLRLHLIIRCRAESILRKHDGEFLWQRHDNLSEVASVHWYVVWQQKSKLIVQSCFYQLTLIFNSFQVKVNSVAVHRPCVGPPPRSYRVRGVWRQTPTRLTRYIPTCTLSGCVCGSWLCARTHSVTSQNKRWGGGRTIGEISLSK